LAESSGMTISERDMRLPPYFLATGAAAAPTWTRYSSA
jgi:hypothetical protein